MFLTKRIITLMLAVLLAGCMQNTEESGQEDTKSEPIKYETEQEQNDYDENDEKKSSDRQYQNINKGDDEQLSDKFTDKLSTSIAKKLKKRQDIKQAQVAATDDKIVVGVMLADKSSPDMRDIVQKEVRDMVPDRDVQVYTDDSYWDRMRNKDAELDQLNGDMREYMQEFFTRDREDF